MQELTFETILRLPQMELKKRLKAELKSRGYPVTDKPGYLYAEGTIPVLLVAHMDTVHRQPVEQVCYSADGAVAMSPQGIGGDDRCGVWMILQILRTTKCHVLFCEDEEVGCVGAKKFTRGSLRPQVNYIVELDRRGSNDAVFYRCDNPEFEGFVTSFGFETASGSCSDISYIAPYLETAAVNISCGYYCEHQRHEYICLEEMELNAARVAQMVTQQTEHFEYKEQQDSFFGGRVYQYSMWDTASERDTYKWLSPLPKEAKIKLGTAELNMPHARIDRQGKVHRYVPKLKAAVLTENGQISGMTCTRVTNGGSAQEKLTGEQTTYTGDYYFSTMPVKDLVLSMGDTVPAKVHDIAKELPYRDFITVGLLVNKLLIKNLTKMKTVNNIVPDCWIYIQERDVRIGRLQIFNNWSPYMPAHNEDTVWMGLEYFCSEGDDMWNMSSEDFIKFAISELVKIDIVKEEDVLDATHIRVKKAYPAYFGTYKDFDQVESYLSSFDNLFCLGRNGQHRYNNMDHSMLTAIEAVNAIKAGSTDKTAIWNVNTEKEYHEEKEA